MGLMEVRGRVQYVVVPVALATGAGAGGRVGETVGAEYGRKRSRGRGARRRLSYPPKY